MSGTELQKSRKPRKKQAVKTTRSATIKAIVERNASNSILLKAPVEVRDNILRLALGDRMIHIQYLSKEDLAMMGWSGSSNTAQKQTTGSLCSSFCVAEKSEQEAYDEANQSSEKMEGTGDPDHIATCNERHGHCLASSIEQSALPIKRLQGERLTFNNNLTVLAVCRLLYEESNNVLLQTNIFSFHDSQSFTQFNASMNPAQKHKLTKIHISLDIFIDAPNWVPWNTSLTPRILTPLKNLKVLRLSFDQYCYWAVVRHTGVLVPHTDSKHYVSQAMDTMLGLRLLSWKDMRNANRGKHVTVIVGDDLSTRRELLTPHWTRTQKLEAAEGLRALLAAPNSIEIHKAEIAAQLAFLQEGVHRMSQRTNLK